MIEISATGTSTIQEEGALLRAFLFYQINFIGGQSNPICNKMLQKPLGYTEFAKQRVILLLGANHGQEMSNIPSGIIRFHCYPALHNASRAYCP